MIAGRPEIVNRIFIKMGPLTKNHIATEVVCDIINLHHWMRLFWRIEMRVGPKT